MDSVSDTHVLLKTAKTVVTKTGNKHAMTWTTVSGHEIKWRNIINSSLDSFQETISTKSRYFA